MPSLAAPSLTDSEPSPVWLEQLNWLAFGGLLVVLVWAPLPLGSNRAWALSLMAMVLCALLLAVVAGALWAGAPLVRPSRSFPARPMLWPLGLLGLMALLVAAQLLPLPLALRSPFVPGADGPGAVSVDPFATRQYLLACLAYLSAFALVTLLARTEQRLRMLLATLVLSGVLQAIVAIALFGSRAEYQFLFTAMSSSDRASGTFPNYNHLAGYMELCLAAGLGLMLSSMRASERPLRGWRQRTVAFLQFAMSRKMLVRLLLVIMVIALVLTRSRMGNAAFFASLLLTGVACALVSRQLRRTAMWLVASLIVVDVLVVGQWVGLDKVVQRMEATSAERAASSPVAEPGAGAESQAAPRHREESLEERWQAARYALQMLPQRPWLGYGGGSFYTAFPQFKGTYPLGFYDHTHNDYVEIAVDMGLPGLALLVLLAASALWRAGRAMGDHSPAMARGLAAGVLMAGLAFALHSAVDFNLQIPANALTFTVILAVAWCLPTRSPRRSLAAVDSDE